MLDEGEIRVKTFKKQRILFFLLTKGILMKKFNAPLKSTTNTQDSDDKTLGLSKSSRVNLNHHEKI